MRIYTCIIHSDCSQSPPSLVSLPPIRPPPPYKSVSHFHLCFILYPEFNQGCSMSPWLWDCSLEAGRLSSKYTVETVICPCPRIYRQPMVWKGGVRSRDPLPQPRLTLTCSHVGLVIAAAVESMAAMAFSFLKGNVS